MHENSTSKGNVRAHTLLQSTTLDRPTARLPDDTMAGNDPTGVKQNAFIESNGLARELIERRFRLTPRTIGAFAVFGIFVPTMIYRGAVKDFVRVRSFLRDDEEDDDACESRRLFFLFSLPPARRAILCAWEQNARARVREV